MKDSGEEGKKGRWGAMDMRRALKDRLANYKIPQVMKVVDHIPRNAMGKSKFFETCLPIGMMADLKQLIRNN